MKILLVRHGETLLNREKVHQTPDTPLSDIGLQQAHKIAKRLKDVKIDKIYVSPLQRAHKTAEIIANELHIPIETRSELEEIKRPTAIVGKKHNDPSVMEIKAQIRENYSDREWHHSDEENFADLKKRVVALLDSLGNENQESTILLVTHGYIAKIIASFIVFGNYLTPESFLHFYNHSELSNTGLSSFEFHIDKGFNLISWNDTTHY